MKGEKVEKRHKRCACITASGRGRGGWGVDGLSKKEKGHMDSVWQLLGEGSIEDQMVVKKYNKIFLKNKGSGTIIVTSHLITSCG